jgi:hypothetical protein
MDIGGFSLMLTALQSVCKEALIRSNQNPDLIAPPEFAETLIVVLDGLQIYQDRLELDPALKLHMQTFRKSLEEGEDLKGNVIHAHARAIVDGIINNLESRLFYLSQQKGPSITTMRISSAIQ